MRDVYQCDWCGDDSTASPPWTVVGHDGEYREECAGKVAAKVSPPPEYDSPDPHPYLDTLRDGDGNPLECGCGDGEPAVAWVPFSHLCETHLMQYRDEGEVC